MPDHAFLWTNNPWSVRLLRRLHRLHLPHLARIWSSIIGVELPANLPASVILPHPYAVVVASGAIIGEGCVIYQNVTIGGDDAGDVPVLEDEVVVFPGACIVGGVRIGRGSRVGANSVVTHDVAAGVTVAGAPARVTSTKNNLARPM